MDRSKLVEGSGRSGIVERLSLAFVVTVIVFIGIRTCFGPEETLAFLFYDDAYYYFGVSRNIAHGLGSTFDGINATNGYHPLWCWILVPLFRVVGDPGTAVRVVGVLWFALAAAAPVALWRALRPRTGGTGAVAAAALFGLQPILAMGLSRPNGLETPLFAVLLAVAVSAYERTLGSSVSRPPSRAAVAGLGALLGVVTLARLDGGFLGVAVAGLLTLHVTRHWGWRVAAGRVVTLVVTATLVAGPSLAWNIVRFGHPVPVSGRVVSHEAERERADNGGVFSGDNLRQRADYMGRSVPLLMAGSFASGTPVKRVVEAAGWLGGIAALLGCGALLALAVTLRRRAGPPLTDGLVALGCFVLLHYGVQAGWLWTAGESLYRQYYYMPETMLVAASLGAVAGPALDALKRRAVRRSLGALGLTVLAAGVVLQSSTRRRAYAAEPGSVADRYIYSWVRRELPPGAILGARDAGKFGFFSGRSVVNLDGLINDQRLIAALRDGKVAEYICRSPIEYLFYDRPWLGGFDPVAPGTVPAAGNELAETLHRLQGLPGCSLREIPGATDEWVVFQVLRE